MLKPLLLVDGLCIVLVLHLNNLSLIYDKIQMIKL